MEPPFSYSVKGEKTTGSRDSLQALGTIIEQLSGGDLDSKAHLENMVNHNENIIKAYRSESTTCADIQLIRLEENKNNVRLEEWEKMTSAKFSETFFPVDHYQVPHEWETLFSKIGLVRM